MPVDDRVLEFVDYIRGAGMQVSVAESIDACRALEVAPLSSPRLLHAALRATLVKSERDYPVFDAAFNEFFLGVEVPNVEAGEEEDREAPEPMSPEDLKSLLAEALLTSDVDRLAALARIAAAMVGAQEGGFGGGSRPLSMSAGPGFYMFRAMEMLDYSQMTGELAGLLDAGAGVGDMPPALASEVLRENIERFRSELEREIRRRVAASRGLDPADLRRKPPPRPEEVDFLNASLRQVEEMRRVLPVLARKLAARIARRQSAGRKGKVDIRNTLRHSISYGGVPMDLKYRKRAPSKPELFILCDVSGSVRTFSTFTLQLVYSLHQQFKAVRSFVFIDRVDEATGYFGPEGVGEAVEQVYRKADVVDGDGHSDVGRALALFEKGFSGDLTPRSTVLILSDARNNMRDPRADVLGRICDRVRRVYWLNPEPLEKWNSGDSVISEYEPHCDSVTECRNLKQLAEFVYRGT
ncbi:MAG: VWA domain-containing protein [Actinobacteria bacterium]|nr:VWA domain-containing protein [Actinomycetota bacterium]MBU1943115.1 VWA domain-containing protein [Actinomycetota bacterium]MBU2687938.1 VWA domain-containing protein [Actinomycetota bacterium]